MDEEKIKELKIGFIGAGKVGFSLGKLFATNAITVTGFYSRHGESAKEAADFTKTKYFENLEDIVKESNVIFITVPDGEISSVYQSIKDFNISEKLICHTSGALNSKDAFESIEELGAYGFSIHPLFPVSSKYDSYKELGDAFFCLEGSKNKISVFEALFRMLGIKTFSIDDENKVKYHAACAIASNLICGIMKESVDLLMECGFTEDMALKALKPLALSNINHILSNGPSKALTGPVERNDIETVNRHIQCFNTEKEADLYKKVSLKVLECAQEKNPERNYEKLKKILENQ